MAKIQIKSNSNGANEGNMGKGIYVDEATITSAVDVTSDPVKNKFSKEVAVELQVELAKNGWKKTVTLGGKLTKDTQTGDIAGLPFNLNDLFKICEIKEIDITEQGVAKEAVDQCIGKELLLLSYTKKKGGYGSWDRVASIDRDKQSFADWFYSNWIKSGYPTAYKEPSANPGPVRQVTNDIQPANNIKQAVDSATSRLIS